MFETLFKCLVAGVIVGGVVGIMERHGSDSIKAAGRKIGDSLDECLDELFPPSKASRTVRPIPVHDTGSKEQPAVH